jgi:hypothetical protein
MAPKINKYLASAARCEQRARKAHSEVDREWQMTLARAFVVLAEAEAEHSALLGREIRTNKAAA